MQHTMPVGAILVATALLVGVLAVGWTPSAAADSSEPSTSPSASATSTVSESPSPEPSPTPTPEPTPSPEPSPTPTPTPDCRGAKDARKGAARRDPFLVCSLPVISKKHRVTASYRPALVSVKVRRSGVGSVRLQAAPAGALKALMAAAKKSGYTLVVRSSYRSWSSQKRAYRRDKVLTAPPGASEHQSGLTVDLAAVRRGRLIRGYGFGSSAAGSWTRRNAADFGFIVRYPKQQKGVTGIPYEPWHLRYVGVEAARAVVRTPTQTLEKYLRIS